MENTPCNLMEKPTFTDYRLFIKVYTGYLTCTACNHLHFYRWRDSGLEEFMPFPQNNLFLTPIIFFPLLNVTSHVNFPTSFNKYILLNWVISIRENNFKNCRLCANLSYMLNLISISKS